MKPAIGLIELSSIARGILVSDDMLKKAPVELLLSKTISPGKYMVLISGDVASVDESLKVGLQTAEPYLVDTLFIPQVHTEILPGIKQNFRKQTIDSLGIVETQSVASTIVSLDQALKASDVHLVELKLGTGIGGKGYFVLTGDLSEVEAAILATKKVLEEGNKLLQTEIIPRPHEELIIRGSL